MIFKKVVKKVKRFLYKNGEILLTVGSLIGLVATVFVTYKKAPDIRKAIESEDLNGVDKAKNVLITSAPVTLSVACTAVLEISALIFARKKYKRAVAAFMASRRALMALYSTASDQEIAEALADNRKLEKPIDIPDDPNLVTYYETCSDTYITDTEEGFNNKIRLLNEIYHKSDCVSILEFLELFDESQLRFNGGSGYDSEEGWNKLCECMASDPSSGWIEFDVAYDSQECVGVPVILWNIYPCPLYEEACCN